MNGYELFNNQIKALVATTALGMGYDKPDLAFVIHYQATGSIVSYYQQVGRAGRGIDHAVGILLSGREDEEIHDYFRRSAFPDQVHVEMILRALEESDGLSLPHLQEQINLPQGKIEQALKFLNVETPSPVIKDGSQWRRTPVRYAMDHEKIRRLTGKREEEWKELKRYIHCDTCLMAFLEEALDDPEAKPCGKCANCRQAPLFPGEAGQELAIRAGYFLKHAEMPLKTKVRIPSGAFETYQLRGNLPEELRAEEGRILCKWNDAGWGRMVAEDKHGNRFRDELLDPLVEMLRDRWKPDPAPAWVTCIPSLEHPELVPDFARRLAERLGVPFVDAIRKIRQNEEQKLQQNTFHRCRNLDGVFEIPQPIPDGPVLLFDDIADSGWTMTLVSALLRQQGSGPVYPLALASTGSGD